MEGQKRLLAFLVTVVCISVPACGGKGCSGFKHLENGQTFFRYGGLLVVFRCHLGFKLHGFSTSSCVSGQWSREPPVCVGSGCPGPGPLNYGISRVNGDGSWTEFSCNSGFHLQGPSMLYCKGRTWNGTKPICKESDMMSSIFRINENKQTTHQNFQALNGHQHPQFTTLSKGKELKFSSGSFSSNILNSEKIPTVKTEEGMDDSQLNQSHEEGEKIDRVWQRSSPQNNLATITSSTLTLVAETESLTSSPASFSATHSTVIPNAPVEQSSQHHQINFAMPMFGFEDLTAQEILPPSVEDTIENEDQHTETGFQSTFVSHPPHTKRLKPTERSNLLTATSTSSPPVSPSPISIYFNVATQSLHGITLSPNMSKTTEIKSLWVEYQNLMKLLSLRRQPVCPYPPVPAHGTFSFQNEKKTDTIEIKHHIQYACYPGYTLAHGDIHRYCQQGGTWSGITPVCLDIDECAVNAGLGSCMQKCHNFPGSYQCSCAYGQVLAGDGHSCLSECPPGYWKQTNVLLNNSTNQTLKNECIDLNECLEDTCEWQCINLPGSHRCLCPRGYTLQKDGQNCKDINECKQKNGGCSHLCVNRRGGYKCACPPSHRLSSYSWKTCLPRMTEDAESQGTTKQ